MVLDTLAIETNHIASHCHLAIFDLHVHRGCLKTASSFEHLGYIVAEKSEVGYL